MLIRTGTYSNFYGEAPVTLRNFKNPAFLLLTMALLFFVDCSYANPVANAGGAAGNSGFWQSFADVLYGGWGMTGGAVMFVLAVFVWLQKGLMAFLAMVVIIVAFYCIPMMVIGVGQFGAKQSATAITTTDLRTGQ